MKAIRKFVGINRDICKNLSDKYPSFFCEASYKDALVERIELSIKNGATKILEAGGIDRPLLKKGEGYVYTGLDIESREKCSEIYDHFVIQSIEEPLAEKYDLIISITLLEHVPDNEASIKSIYLSLLPNGETHHYIPSKWHPYSIALRMVGPVIQKKLIPILRPGTEDVTGYPAFFNHCSAPAMKALFVKSGFSNINVRASYRANDYFAFFVPFFLLVTVFENLCRTFNFNLFASGFIISAQKVE